MGDYVPNIAHPEPDGASQPKNRYFLAVLGPTNPEQLFATLNVKAKSLLFYGLKSYNGTTGAGTNNTGNVKFGGLDEAGKKVLPEVITPGNANQWSPAAGCNAYDLSELWFSGAAGDGVLAVVS